VLGAGRLWDGKRQAVSYLEERLASLWKINLERKKSEIALRAEKLEALSPLRVLRRGYCVAESGGVLVASVDDAEIGAPLSITLSDGKISAVVQNKEKLSHE
jgi:exodeoxyribonuclease VII large subunit